MWLAGHQAPNDSDEVRRNAGQARWASRLFRAGKLRKTRQILARASQLAHVSGARRPPRGDLGSEALRIPGGEFVGVRWRVL